MQLFIIVHLFVHFSTYIYIYTCVYCKFWERVLIPINLGKPNNDDGVKSQLRRYQRL